MRARRLHATSLGSEAKLQRDRLFATLTPTEARALLYDWAFWARTNQLPPDGEWRVWLVLAGRGFGKTRTGAEMIRAGRWPERRAGLPLWHRQLAMRATSWSRAKAGYWRSRRRGSGRVMNRRSGA